MVDEPRKIFFLENSFTKLSIGMRNAWEREMEREREGGRERGSV